MKPARHFDHIVLGTGSMGAATCWELARRGESVLGIDRFNVPHDRGSHGGETRIIRKAYYEHPDYIPLLQAAYAGWEELEAASNQQHFFRTGLLYAGREHSSILQGVVQSAKQYGIELDRLAWSDAPSARFNLPADYTILFEPDAGFIRVDTALKSLMDQARIHGAEFLTNTPVVSWTEKDDGITVQTTSETFTCDKLIITAGAWTSSLLPSMADKLTVTRQVLAWYDVGEEHAYGLGDFPCWLIAEPGLPGPYYGFPSIEQGKNEMKVAYHHRGPIADPDLIAEKVSEQETEALNRFVKKTFKGVSSAPIRTAVCMYVNSPDDHFIIDRIGRVSFACGFSGHGFKFVPAIGSALADLSIKATTDLPIGFLSSDRFD
ncbi:MAG: N-methyl-L-tryptophan oxidase [Bacteroidota bacterium]